MKEKVQRRRFGPTSATTIRQEWDNLLGEIVVWLMPSHIFYRKYIFCFII
jgi:hypothetical protein